MLREVRLGDRDIRQLEPFVGSERVAFTLQTAETFRQWLKERTIWNVSSTAVGGGVAEMLVPLLSYSKSMGVRIRWLVMQGNEPFFRVTKRVHHALHGSMGDGSALGEHARRIYEETSRLNAEALEAVVGPGDIALLHDPQTAGLAAPLLERGLIVIWRCHIGHDEPLEEVQRGWEFLRPYLRSTPAYVFSSPGYVPPFCEARKTHIIQPSIDAMSPKNQHLSEGTVYAALHRIGVLGGPEPLEEASFCRTNGTIDRIRRRADVVRQGQPPSAEVPMVVQVSRWDPLKDMAGVMHGFVRLIEKGGAGAAHLILAGPDVRGVEDDPEGPAVFGAAADAWRMLPSALRERITLCMLPTADIEENAAIVNALQSHAAVVVQKSVQEGFGLTVTEAMWKARPVLASAVGGIRDQIEHGVHGLLLRDPLDLGAFGEHLDALLRNRDGLAESCRLAARERVRRDFLGVRHLLQYAELIQQLQPRGNDASAVAPSTVVGE